MIEKEVYWANQTWILNNLKCLYWPTEKALILSDLHVGKSAHFRKHGIPIPSSSQTKDLDNLEKALTHYDLSKIIIVGDLFHAGHNSDVEEFKEILKNYPHLEVILIKGNHDRLSNQKIQALGIHQIHETFELNGILFSHELIPTYKNPQISGHVHTGVEIPLPNRTRIRLPAFWFSEMNLLLPAFCSFTGLDTNIQLKQSQIYAITDSDIIRL